MLQLPDLSGFSEEERIQLMAVMKKVQVNLWWLFFISKFSTFLIDSQVQLGHHHPDST